ncbi:hypothetical protein [Pseudonocardia sp. ICBG1142]|uniref:hypothetical protein n=1 Tax=Pseudonocardia sp. ICBG1142 TaxID=2846760 RepID=UPI001CF6A700|nr:hypothetical protein [Pseudonocardia sp. ICBG1142]
MQRKKLESDIAIDPGCCGEVAIGAFDIAGEILGLGDVFSDPPRLVIVCAVVVDLGGLFRVIMKRGASSGQRLNAAAC